mgnify:CR=1 FL=1
MERKLAAPAPAPAAVQAPALRQRLADIDLAKWGPFIALVLVCIIATVASPYFLMTRNLLNVARSVALMFFTV